MLRVLRVSFSTILLLGVTAATAVAGKPPKNPPPPPASPVTYSIKTFQMPVTPDIVDVQQMTSTGVVVGSYQVGGVEHPFIYDPSVDADFALDLNADFNVVLSDSPGVSLGEAGLRIVFASDINEHRFVVGAIEEIENPGFRRGYLLDLTLNPAKLYMLPDDGLGDTYARRINDNMDIAGTCDLVNGSGVAYLYNPMFDTTLRKLDLSLPVWRQLELSNPAFGQPAQLAGQAGGFVFRYTQGVGLDPNVNFAGAATDISPTGTLCGGYNQLQKSGRTISSAFRYGSTLQTYSDWSAASAINGHGDFATHKDRTLFHEGTGAIKLNDVVIGTTSNDLSFWSNAWYCFISDMTERGAINSAVPGFPGICGKLTGGPQGSRGFVLVPVIP